MNRGHYCTKIHKCYADALRRIGHLGLALCRWQRRGTTANVLRHFTRKNNKSNNVICHSKEFMILEPSVETKPPDPFSDIRMLNVGCHWNTGLNMSSAASWATWTLRVPLFRLHLPSSVSAALSQHPFRRQARQEKH